MSHTVLDVQPVRNSALITSGADCSGREPQNSDGQGREEPRWKLELTLSTLLSGLLLIGYAVAFIRSLQGRWFNHLWTTDDATQQTYPLYEVLQPGLFDGDLITEVMRGCLPPLHYWISAAMTLFTKDPIMTGHWVMLIQVTVAVVFLFAAIRSVSATAPALLGVVWLLHSRNTMQRMTGGLPRGWTPAIFAMFFYCVFRGYHFRTLAVVLAGCLLNPPGALIVGVTYGFMLLWKFFALKGPEAALARKRIVSSLVLAPLFGAVALAVVHRPPHIGQMVSFEEASQMPEFQSFPKGRFPFLPLMPAYTEFRLFGVQAFLSRFYKPADFWRHNMLWVALSALVVTALVARRRRRSAFPAEVMIFGMTSLLTYGIARQFAFKLFVPDRHIQIPMVFFFITAFCVGSWRALHRGHLGSVGGSGSLRDNRLRYSLPCFVGLAIIGALVVVGSGSGLKGDANFNYPTFKKGGMFRWISRNTSSDALIACHPTHCDGLQLLAVRKAFVTTETSHPFYPRYNLEMRRRSEISLRAQYSESLEELVMLLEPEGITHFVFRRADFREEKLAQATYFPPLDSVVRELVTRPSGKFAYYQLPAEVDLVQYPFMTFKDSVSVIIDVKALGAYLRQHGWVPPQSSLNAAIQRHAAHRHTIVARDLVHGDGLRS